jgi:hypothetical protein
LPSSPDDPTTHGDRNSADPPACYEIRVQGILDGRWSAWFEGRRITGDELGQAIIVSPVVDQEALHGLPAKIRSWASNCSGCNVPTLTDSDMEACDAAGSEPEARAWKPAPPAVPDR